MATWVLQGPLGSRSAPTCTTVPLLSPKKGGCAAWPLAGRLGPTSAAPATARATTAGTDNHLFTGCFLSGLPAAAGPAVVRLHREVPRPLGSKQADEACPFRGFLGPLASLLGTSCTSRWTGVVHGY